MDKPILTASEIGMLWTQYIQNSMTIQIMKHFQSTVQDKDIKFLDEKSLMVTENVESEIGTIFHLELQPIQLLQQRV
jgi:queuine/archaeosine tRNA-ribosyltransferase